MMNLIGKKLLRPMPEISSIEPLTGQDEAKKAASQKRLDSETAQFKCKF